MILTFSTHRDRLIAFGEVCRQTIVSATMFVAVVSMLLSASAQDTPINPPANENSLPAGATIRLGSVAAGEARRFSGVYDIAFAPDEKTIATRGLNHVVVLWDAQTGEQLQEFDGHESYVRDIGFTPDGAELLTASDGVDEKVYCWDPKTGEKIRAVPGGAKLMRFLSDEQLMLASAQRTDRVMLRSGEIVKRSAAQRLPLAISHDGRLVLAMRNMTDKMIGVYDAQRQILSLRGLTAFPTMGAFSPDASLVAACGKPENFVRVWDAKTGQPKYELGGHQDNVQMLAFSPDGRLLATAGWDGAVMLWETLTGRRITSLQAHTEHVCAVAFSKSGNAFASGASGKTDNSVLVWSLQQTALKPTLTADEIAAVGFELVWEQLADPNPEVAWGAAGSLVAEPTIAIDFIHRQLDPVLTPIRLERIEQLVRELDDDDYYVREAASKALLEQRPAVDPELTKALLTELSTEARYRLQRLLSDVPPASQLSDAEQRRLFRTILTLEKIADGPAREMLAEIRTGHPNADVKLEARKAMERLP